MTHFALTPRPKHCRRRVFKKYTYNSNLCWKFCASVQFHCLGKLEKVRLESGNPVFSRLCLSNPCHHSSLTERVVRSSHAVRRWDSALDEGESKETVVQRAGQQATFQTSRCRRRRAASSRADVAGRRGPCWRPPAASQRPAAASTTRSTCWVAGGIWSGVRRCRMHCWPAAGGSLTYGESCDRLHCCSCYAIDYDPPTIGCVCHWPQATTSCYRVPGTRHLH